MMSGLHELRRLNIEEDEVLSEAFDLEKGSGDHELELFARFDPEEGRAKRSYGYKPGRGGPFPGTSSYSRIYTVIRKCRLCGMEVSGGGHKYYDCDAGTCTICEADIDPEEADYGRCSGCRGSEVIDASEEQRNKWTYRSRRGGSSA